MSGSVNDQKAIVASRLSNIRNISELHSQFEAALSEFDTIEVDIDGAEDVDLSFIQLIEAARLSAKQANKSIRLVSPASGAVLETLRRAGFLDDLSTDDAKFWLHEENK